MDVADTGTKTLLASHGLESEERWPWTHVGATARQEGWKIHLTCTPSTLSTLIEHILRVRCQTPFVFKAASSTEIAMLLNEGTFGDTQVGKCATIYPDDDDSFTFLVDEFRKIDDLAGPSVRNDIRLGKIVFARFGSFNPIMRRDLLGQVQAYIQDEHDGLVPDRYDAELTRSRFSARFSGKPIFRHVWPFDALPTGIVNGHYLVIDALNETSKGALLQAIDMQSKGSVRAVILKQGRAHALSDRYGHDIRDRLRHQERMHLRAAQLHLVPECDPYFQIGEDGYLPILFQRNDNFEKWVQKLLAGQTIDRCPTASRERLFETLDTIGTLLEQLHTLGIVHRDISPSNILIQEDGGPLISDLEIAWDATSDVIYGKGTPGFMAPEQMAGAPPAPSADIHAFSALILYAITGLDPRRLPLPERSDDWQSLSRLGRSLSPGLWRAVKAGLSANPEDRPTLASLRTMLRGELGKSRRPPKGERLLNHQSFRGLLVEGTRSLSSPALLDSSSGLWLSPSISTHSQGVHLPEIRRSLNRGVAGPLYYCSLYQQHIDLDDDLRELCERTAQWLIVDRGAGDYGMPGLHFGESGVLLALYQARAAGLVSFKHEDVDHLWRTVLEPDPNWPDFTHGAAGISTAIGLISELLAGEALSLPFDLVSEQRRQISYLIESQNSDGSWTLPDGVGGLSGEVVTGFAHGVAGIAFALATAPDSVAGGSTLDSAMRAADWLIESAQPTSRGGLIWPYSSRQPEPWNWWCHGAPGISSLFLALYQKTGRPDFRDTVLRCFVDTPQGFNPANLSQCHGAAGLCELLLDAADALQSSNLRSKALSIAENIYARHARGSRDIYWIVESPDFVGADLMVGLSGVLHLLLRLVRRNAEIGFPLLPRAKIETGLVAR